jgi:hypothetical protein
MLKILIFSNCHGEYYKNILEKNTNILIFFEIRYIISYENLSNYKNIKEDFENADIILINPIENYDNFRLENIKKIMKKDCKLIVIPFIRFDGFWLEDKYLKLLHQPLWKTGVDLSFKLNKYEFINGDMRGPISIINYENLEDKYNNPKLVFDQDLMKGTTEEANEIIENIIDIYYKCRIEHNLLPGEIILIDNNRAVHGRSNFTPNYDNYDRFLIRCFATFDYEKSNYARKERIIQAIYS